MPLNNMPKQNESRGRIAAFQALPSYLQLAVVVNAAPIVVVIGFMLLCFYGLVTSFIWSDPAGTSGLAGLVSIVFLMFSAVLLGVLATPLAIALSSRKKAAAYVSVGVGAIGICVVLLAVALKLS